MKVKLSKQLANRVGARKLAGESLDEAVCRLLDEFLREQGLTDPPEGGRIKGVAAHLRGSLPPGVPPAA